MSLPLDFLSSTIQHSLEDSKALDITTISLRGKTDIAESMVIATGTSARHVSSIAENLAQALKDAGHPSVQLEGLRTSDWVLVDADDIIVHIFRPEAREHYALERMWEHAAAVRDKQA